MNATSYDKGMEEGIEKGMEKGRRFSLRELLEERFGPVSPKLEDRLERLSLEQVISLTRAVVRAQALKELELED
jgi:hypothetical protein